MTDFAIAHELASYLIADEQLVWSGRPRGGIIFKYSDFFVIPFSALWLGFAFFWKSQVINMNAPLIFRFWGIPFIVVGLHALIGRFFLDAKERENTIYGITDSRIIIKSGIFSKDIKSINIHSISDITVSQKYDKSCTILLGPVEYSHSKHHGKNRTTVKQPPTLEYIEEAEKVYNLIINLQSIRS